jgi:hypothetical protein
MGKFILHPEFTLLPPDTEDQMGGVSSRSLSLDGTIKKEN